MKRNSIIASELKAGRSVELITRRLYSVEPPISLLDSREKLFDILEMCSSGLGISILDIKIAGSGQSGYSFHKQKPFVLGESDLDLAVISRDFFERLLQGVQKVALPDATTSERPRRNAFPEIAGNSTYARFTENVALYGYILPNQIPQCNEKASIFRVSRQLTEKYSSVFKSINLAFYMSQYFFERKQMANIGLYMRTSAMGG